MCKRNAKSNLPEQKMITCKESMYRTARIAKPVGGLHKGDCVAVMYHGKSYNAALDKVEAVYSIGRNNMWLRHVFASYLTNFVL